MYLLERDGHITAPILCNEITESYLDSTDVIKIDWGVIISHSKQKNFYQPLAHTKVLM